MFIKTLTPLQFHAIFSVGRSSRKGEPKMKKAVILTTLIVIGISLVAAVPVNNFGPEPGKKLCFNPATGQMAPCPRLPTNGQRIKIKLPGQGEPRMEKVSYFHYSIGSPGFWRLFWSSGFKFLFTGGYGCAKWYWWIGTYKMPLGCSFRYQY